MKALIIHEIIKSSSRWFGVSMQSVRSCSRRRAAVRARWVAMYIVRKATDATLEEIGLAFNRNHSSVLHGINFVKEHRYFIGCARFIKNEITGPERRGKH